MKTDFSPDEVNALESSALATLLALEYYALPAVAVSLWLPVLYLFMAWYVALGLFSAICFVWTLFRDNPHKFGWIFVVRARRCSIVRYPLMLSIAAYFVYEHQWWMAGLSLITPLISGVAKLLLLSGKVRQVEEIESVFFNGIMEAADRGLVRRTAPTRL